MFSVNYNPDVLTCLANLSSDEVFTPPNVANEMLDQLPEELWSDKNTTFLDPCTKSGIFLREVTKRLLVGLEDEIPDLQKRINHILTKQVFGIGITELTALLARRSLYCSKNANQEFSITKAFSNNDGNIFYKNIEHKWKNLKCEYCGASKDLFNRQDFLEQHAYNFIHTDNLKELFNMNFDVIIGNPPYQMQDGSGGASDSAMPIYNKFIETGIKLNPTYLSMIVPSKWMVGGRGLDKFRKSMIEENRMKYIKDFEKSSECFPGVKIDGGICYFLWEKNYSGKVDYTFVGNDGSQTKTKRSLKNDSFKYVIRDNRINSIIEKVKDKNSFKNIVSKVKPFGIRGYLFNEPARYPNSKLSEVSFSGSVKIYGVKGIKGGAKRVVGYIDKSIITKNQDAVNKYKLFFTTSFSSNAVEPPKAIFGDKNEICTETFLMIGPFDSEKKQKNCYDFIQTKFFKALLYYGKGTMHVTSEVFSLIPCVNFNESWNDKKLFDKYDFNDDEIKIIESLFI
tara:strand:+ start:961 stop:2490 length:1530 start_codon:yes stop_codon:yes gene_type:complete